MKRKRVGRDDVKGMFREETKVYVRFMPAWRHSGSKSEQEGKDKSAGFPPPPEVS